jgi:hypothetical protein
MNRFLARRVAQQQSAIGQSIYCGALHLHLAPGMVAMVDGDVAVIAPPEWHEARSLRISGPEPTRMEIERQ